MTDRMPEWQRLCVVQTDGQITGLLSANLRIQPARWPQGKKVPKRLDASKLKQDSKKQAFINDICCRLDAMELTSDDPEENWTVFRDTVHSSAIDSLGPVSRIQRLVWREWQRNPGSPWRETRKTKKYGLSTLIVFLIGHHLSMMTLSTDYHRWNVICCLTNSQPSLKQWQQ